MARTILPDGRVIEEPPQFAGPAVPSFPGTGGIEATFEDQGNGQPFPPLPEFIQQRGLPQNQHTPQFNDALFGELFAQQPFPPELVPPFEVEGGLTDDPDSLFGMFLNNQGYTPAVFSAANVNLGEFGATTRQVQSDELVSEQLNSLLNKDSTFMQNALLRGRELAQDRGALSSSIFAGASQRAAVEAGVPIASANAQAYMQAASENMNALNQNTLARMQASVNLAISNSQTAAQVSVANTNASAQRESSLIGLQGARLAADSRERVAEATLNAQFSMQQTQFLQDQLLQLSQLNSQSNIANLQAGTSLFLGGLQSDTNRFTAGLQADTSRFLGGLQSDTSLELGRLQAQTTIDVSRMNDDTRIRLQEMGIEGNFSLQELTHAQTIQLEEMFREPRWRAEYQLGLAQTRAQLQISALNTWSAAVQSLNGLDIDDPGRNRAMTFFNNLIQEMNMVGERNLNPANWDFNWDAILGGGG